MRSVAPFVLFVTLSLIGCAVLNPNASEYASIQGAYELISLNGQPLPVEMGNGEILVGGTCSLFRGSRRSGRTFSIWLDYEGTPRGGANPVSISGTYAFLGRESVQERWQLRFHASRYRGASGADPTVFEEETSNLRRWINAETDGSIQGEVLTVGGEGDLGALMVFRKTRS